jgi:hypothetical protein
MSPTLKEPETAAEWRAAHDVATTACDLLRAERDAALARAERADESMSSQLATHNLVLSAWHAEQVERHAAVIRAEAAEARADLAEARLAKVIQYLHDEASEAHDIFMQPGPPNMKKYYQVEALEMCLEEARRISKEEKPNRAILIVKEVE